VVFIFAVEDERHSILYDAYYRRTNSAFCAPTCFRAQSVASALTERASFVQCEKSQISTTLISTRLN